MELMGFGGASTAAATTTIGAFYFVGGLGLTISGVSQLQHRQGSSAEQLGGAVPVLRGDQR